MHRRKPIDGFVSGVTDQPKDNRVPGELVVKLTRKGHGEIRAAIPTGPARTMRRRANGFGIPEIDKVLGKLGCDLITRVHAPLSPRALGDKTSGDLAWAMHTTYRLRFQDAGLDLDASASMIDALASVEVVSPNHYLSACLTPNDPRYPDQWGLRTIHCPAAWEKTTGHPALKVAVLDSGMDLDHPELRELRVAGRDYVDLDGVPPPTGWYWDGDYMSRDSVPEDQVGHGTHVAGIVSASGNNRKGIAAVTWRCKILPIKVVGRAVNFVSGAVEAKGINTDLAAGMGYAAHHPGVPILNISLASPDSSFAVADAVAYTIARGRGIVASMGNNDSSVRQYPAAFPDVFAVGAVDDTLHRVTSASTGGGWGSNTGPHIDLVAPGRGILSAFWDDTYMWGSGTSMAAPFVAGVAALMISCNGALTRDEIVQILHASARKLNGATEFNNEYGHGLVDAKAALEMACP